MRSKSYTLDTVLTVKPTHVEGRKHLRNDSRGNNTLYRAVLKSELDDIAEFGAYHLPKGQAEVKGFFSSVEEAAAEQTRKSRSAERALNVYGAEGVKNGVTILAKGSLGDDQTQVAGVAGRKTEDNPTRQDIHVTFDTKSFDSDVLGANWPRRLPRS